MQNRNSQTKVWNNASSKSQVQKLKLVLASVLLLVVIVLAGLAIPFLSNSMGTVTAPTHARTVIIQATTTGTCDPQPNC